MTLILVSPSTPKENRSSTEQRALEAVQHRRLMEQPLETVHRTRVTYRQSSSSRIVRVFHRIVPTARALRLGY
jgi:hypothetical protein